MSSDHRTGEAQVITEESGQGVEVAMVRATKESGMGKVMKRWSVSVSVDCDDDEDVEAASEAEAIRVVTDRIENAGLGIWVSSASAKEISYERPAGTDRWAIGADEIRFAEDLTRYVAGDGCWWWTNGHVALRCEGDPPKDAKLVTPARTIAEVVGDDKRERIKWGPTNPEGLRVVTNDMRLRAKADYLQLVECGCPPGGVEWFAAEGDQDEPWRVPFTAHVGGELVAVLMGVRP